MRRALWIAAICLTLLPLGAYSALRLGLATPLVNLVLRRELSGYFNGALRFGLFRTDLFNFAEITDLVVMTSHGEASIPVLTADRIRVNFSLFDTLRGGRSIEDALDLALIKGMKVFLLRDAKGHWNVREILRLPEGSQKRQKKSGERQALPPLAARLVLEDSTVIFNDERRGFQSTVEGLEGTLDARAFPLLAFSLSGRTDGKESENLSLAGEWNPAEGSIFARADMEDVSLDHYLNYALPSGGLQFLGGTASLSTRIQQANEEAELEFSGRADVKSGSLAIPGIKDPLTDFSGTVVFGADKLSVEGIQAAFLGSVWKASGQLSDLKHPQLALTLENPSVPLAELSAQIHGLSPLHLSGTASLSVTVTGQAVDPQVQGRLAAPELDIAGIHLSQVGASFEMGKHGLKVPALNGLLWNGQVQGKAALAFPSKKGGIPGSIEASLSGEGVDLALARYRSLNYLPLRGTGSLHASVKGELGRPQVLASFHSADALFGQKRLGRLDLEAKVLGHQLGIEMKTWDGKLDAKVGFDFERGRPARFTESKASFRAFPIHELMAAVADAPDSVLTGPKLRELMARQLKHYRAVADMDMRLEGELKHPLVSLDLLSHHGTWKLGPDATADPYGLPFELKGQLSISPQGLRFGASDTPLRLWFTQSGHVAEMLASGSLALKAASATSSHELKLSLNADLGVLEALKFVKRARGKALLDLRLGGALASMSANGWLQVKDLSADMDRYFKRIKNGEAELWIREQTLTIENLSFDSVGSFESSGRLDFSSGLKPFGAIEARSDAKGLRLDNFGYGGGYVVLDPLELEFQGVNGMRLSGKASAHDMVIQLPKPKPKVEVGEPSNPYPITFALKAEIGDNVWLKKVNEGTGISDPLSMLRDAIQSAQETLLSPAFEFKLRPSIEPFSIEGAGRDMKLNGIVAIERGTFNFMENEFQIKQDLVYAQVKFDNRRRGDVRAQAMAPMRYMAEGVGGKLEPKTVQVTVDVSPLSEEGLEKAGLQDSFLNYFLDFDSQPKLANNPEQNRQAVLSLLILGDPMLDGSQAGTDGSSSKMSAEQLLTIQGGRVASSYIRKMINKYAHFLGSSLVDYVRVAPRVSRGTSTASPGVAAGTGISKQIQQEGFRVSWLFEVGKSVTRNLYNSAQLLFFGDDDLNSAKNESSAQVNKDVRNWGVRLAAEYRLSPTRMLIASYSYSADDNLEPVPFDPNKLEDAHRFYAGIRNTIATENYGPRQAHERHMQALEHKELLQ